MARLSRCSSSSPRDWASSDSNANRNKTRGSDIVPVPGSRNPLRVAQNIAAADLTLTADDLATIDRIAPDGGTGGRM